MKWWGGAVQEESSVKTVSLDRAPLKTVTPIDLCSFRIYEPNYYQLKGPDTAIKGYNTVTPDGWGMP